LIFFLLSIEGKIEQNRVVIWQPAAYSAEVTSRRSRDLNRVISWNVILPGSTKITLPMNKLFGPLLLAAVSVSCLAQQDCETISNSRDYFSASGSASTEHEARINALSLLAENISSTVSSKTNMLTKDDTQTYSNASVSTSVLHLKGVAYITCDRSKKNGVTVLAFISKKDLIQSSNEVAARVQQYLELMEQKEAAGVDILPEAYIAYLHTYMSPYAIEYNSTARHISNVRSYLESFLRTYLSNVNVTCTAVTENPNYPEQQLTLSLLLAKTNGTRMKFLLKLPEYSAQAKLDNIDNTIDVIMAPDGKMTRFSGTLSLEPPLVEADLKEISDHVLISRSLSFEADMSGVIRLDFNSQLYVDELTLTPVVRHVTIRQIEWISGEKVLSTEQTPRLAAFGLNKITMRVNGTQALTITKTLDTTVPSGLARGSDFTYRGPSIKVEPVFNYTRLGVERPDSSFPDDAVVYVHSGISNLVFRSSMSSIDRQTYDASAKRYEVLVQPVKQILLVEADGLTEKPMGIINPNTNDEIHFRVSPLAAETLLSKGVVAITSDPANASIVINDIETVYKTPFNILIPGGLAKISLRKKYYQPMDTVIQVDSRTPVDLSVKLVRMPGYTAEEITAAEALRYLQGKRRNLEPVELSPTELAEQKKLQDYNRQTMLLRRNAALGYTTAGMGLAFGAYFGWIDRMLYDGHTGHSSTLASMSDASYIMGGVGLVAGIIYSAKLSKVKKNWSIQPAPNAKGMGVAVTFKF
jgi:hypothetical protein